MNIENLTPAPWIIAEDGHPVWFQEEGKGAVPWWASGIDESEGNPYKPYKVSFDTLEGVALLRNAFDVQMRRRWEVFYSAGKWCIDVPTRLPFDGGSTRILGNDPASTLLQANKWYKEHVEKVQG